LFSSLGLVPHRISEEHSFTEAHSPWQNKCENVIGVLNKKVKATRARRGIPKCVWDYQITF